MDETDGKTNYSADVDMWMDCDGHGRVPLAQASSTFVVAAMLWTCRRAMRGSF